MRSQLLSKFRSRKGLILLFMVEGLLLLLFPPCLVLSPSHLAGGDTPSHLPAAVALRESLTSGGPLFTWLYGNFAGFPLFLNYFPFPFFLMGLLSLVIPLQVAFKLVTLLPIFGLPAAIYACLKKLGCEERVAALGSALAVPFLVMKENPMWGGNITSTLAGEFCYGIALVLAVYLTGAVFHDIAHRRSLCRNSLLEALVALSSGYPLLQFGFASSYFLLRKRFIPYLIAMHSIAFGLISFWILPLILRLPWDTSFNHAWNFESWREPLPVALFPALLGIPLGWVACRLRSPEAPAEPGDSNGAGPEHYLWWNIGIALAFFGLGPAIGLVDIRFLPFAHVYLILLGAIGWGKVLDRLPRRAAWPGVAAAFVVAAVWTAAGSGTVAAWIRWNYSGFEAKPLRRPFEQVNQYLRGTGNSPRVVYEHSEITNGAGTVRAFELLPYFSGRSTLEGLYMQSSVSSPFIFYVQSELTRTPSCPFAHYYYSRFDADRAAKHLRVFNVGQVISATDETAAALDRSPDYRPEIAFPPYRIHSVVGSGDSYVEPLRFLPHRIDLKDWKRTQFEWFRRSALDVVLVVGSEGTAGTYWKRLPPYGGNPEALPRLGICDPAAPAVKATATLEKDRIAVETSTPHHPLWLKVSYHPDWRISEGAGELYLASPAFMLLVPETSKVVLRFDTSGGTYAVGRAVTLLTILSMAVFLLFNRRRRRPASSCSSAGPDEHGAPVDVPLSGGESAAQPARCAGQPRDGLLYPAVPVLIWIVLAATVVFYAWHRDDRDPLLLYHKALKTYERAEAALNARNDPAASGRPAAAKRAPAVAEARELFLRCLKEFPLSPVVDHAAHYVAVSFMLEDKWRDAADFYEGFLAAYPESRIYPEALYELGVAESRLGRAEAANRRYWQTATFFPESERAVAAAAELAAGAGSAELLRVAREYYVQGSFFCAYPLLKALSDQPASSVQTEASLLCAYSLFYQNRWSDSAKLFSQWLKNHPDHPEASRAFVTLGQCHLSMGAYKEARQSFRGALGLDPGLEGSQPFRAMLRTAEELAGPGD